MVPDLKLMCRCYAISFSTMQRPNPIKYSDKDDKEPAPARDLDDFLFKEVVFQKHLLHAASPAILNLDARPEDEQAGVAVCHLGEEPKLF